MNDVKTALTRAFRLSFEGDRKATVTTLFTFGLRPMAGLIVSYLIKVLIDGIGSLSLVQTLSVVAAICLVGAGNSGIAQFSLEYATRMIEATGAAADHALMRVLGRFPLLSDLEDPKAQDELEYLRQERQRLAEGVDSFSLMLGITLRSLATAVVLALINPWLILTPVFAVPLVILSRRNAARRASAIQASGADSRLARHLYETASTTAAGREIRLLGNAAAVRARHSAVGARADRIATSMLRGNLARTLTGGFVFGLGYVGALWLVLRDYANHTATLGDLVLALNLVTGLTLQLSLAIRYYAFLQQTMEAALRLCRLEAMAGGADAAPAESRPESGTTATGTPAATVPTRLTKGIELSGVDFRYPGAESQALHGVNLTLPAGGSVLVVGENGAGKTTLIKLLTGMYRPTAGTITVDGEPLDALDATTWRTRCSAAFQDFVRFEFPVRESVGLGDVAALDEPDTLRRALKEGGADSFVDAFPAGTDTPLGHSFPDGRDLSGGEWQRLALARSRMRPAALLTVLDEPTAAIDPMAEAELMERYMSAARATAEESNGITLMASHRLSTGRFADVIVVLREGRLVECGSHRELMALPDGVYRDLYSLQMNAYN